MESHRPRIALWRLCGIGDAVQLTPLLQQIRHDEPRAEVFCFISENAAPALRGAPWIDHLVPLPIATSRPAITNPGLVNMWRFIAQHGPFDSLLCLGSQWSVLVGSCLVSAKKRAGFVSESWKPFSIFTHPYPVPTATQQDRKHESLKYLELWAQLSGGCDAGFGYALPHLGQDLTTNDFALRKPYLCYAPGVGNPFSVMTTKRWPAECFAELMQRTMAAGYQAVILGVPGDFQTDLIPSGALDLQGKTDLHQAASILRHAAGFIGNDSGLFHLALGLGTPALAFFGPTDPAKTGPFRAKQVRIMQPNLPCAPCFAETCHAPGFHPASLTTAPPCMTASTVTQAWDTLHNLLAASA